MPDHDIADATSTYARVDQPTPAGPIREPPTVVKSAHRKRRGALAALWSNRWYILFGIVLAGLAGWQGVSYLIGPRIAVDRVERGTLVQTVVASGHIETPYRVEIGSQITDVVTEVLVEEGQHVTKGQPLIQLDRRELEAAMVQANGAVAQAEARMRQLKELTLPVAKENLDQAQATLKDAQVTFDRTEQMAQTGYETRSALDDAQKALDVARTQVNAAQFQVYTASPGGSDYVMAQTQLDQANANLLAARSRLDYTLITAPRDGVLISRSVERGTIAAPGRALLVLAPAGDIQIVVDVDERNLGLLTLGQKAVASADAYPNQRFPAIVSYINPGVDITRATVEVKLKVIDPPDYLRQDMTVSVDIEVARRDDTLILRQRSIRELTSDDPWVLAVRDGVSYRQPVTVGLRGEAQVEILEGLKQGDLALPTSAPIKPGQRLRPVLP